MNNTLAVYTAKSPLKLRQLADLALDNGIQLRYMALGGYIFSDMDQLQNKALSALNGGAQLLVGGFASDSAVVAEFDHLIEMGDRLPIATMLNGGKLPWCELYSTRFDYETKIKTKPKNKAKLDGSISKSQLPELRSAKTQYIIYNQSRKKNGQQLMTHLAKMLAGHTDGIVADYQR